VDEQRGDICWLGGWDRGHLFFLSPAIAVSSLAVSLVRGNPLAQFRPAGRMAWERGAQPLSGLSGPGEYGVARRLRIPAKEIVCSDLMSIIYRAQRSRQSYVEPL